MELRDTEFAWLAGIIDGEGNFYVNSKESKTNGVKYLDVKVRISSTDMRMIKRISEIYKALNLKFHFARVNMNHGTWKPAISVNVTSQAGVLRLLCVVIPYLVNKKRQAEAISRIVSFVSRFPKGGNTIRQNYWNTAEMNKLVSEYEAERKWYFDPSTTTRKANSIFEFGDIV